MTPVQQTLLEAVHMCAQKTLSGRDFEGMIGDRAEISVRVPQTVFGLVAALHSHIWSYKHDDIEYAVWESGTQHFKYDLCIRWPWLNRWLQPVGPIIQRIRIYDGYPEMKLPPNKGPVRIVLKTEETDFWRKVNDGT